MSVISENKGLSFNCASGYMFSIKVMIENAEVKTISGKNVFSQALESPYRNVFAKDREEQKFLDFNVKVLLNLAVQKL